MSDLVKAEWVPIWECVLADGTTLQHGSTALIPRAEAAASDNWRIVKTEKPARTDETKDAD
jgi:hypothetical protein